MADVYTVGLTGKDHALVVELAERRDQLGLATSKAAAIRGALVLALSADDETLKRGTMI